MAIVLALAMMENIFSLTETAAIILSMASFYLLYADRQTRRLTLKNPKFIRRLFSILGYIGISFATVITILFSYTFLNYDAFGRFTQYLFTPKQNLNQEIFTNERGFTIYKNVTYPSTAKNNQMDIVTVPNAKGTVFYVHGGGYVIGTKVSSNVNYLTALTDAGYNVVNIDYQLAPQAKYPSQIKQANQALKFMVAHAATYQIDTSKIVLGGDSAGGQIVGQLANLITNEQYAKSMDLTPPKVKLRGIILNSALVDMPRFGKTSFYATDYIFTLWGEVTFGQLDFANSDNAKQASVLTHVTSDFPPTYDTDGNFATFTDQNQDLVEKLKSLGVYVEDNFYSKNKIRLFHVYQANIHSKYGKDNLKKTISFLNKVTK
jgi:acetyl esterase/lipase